jgi:hypothetical protein
MRRAGEDLGDLGVVEATELPAVHPGAVQDACLHIAHRDLALIGRAEGRHACSDRGRQIPAFLELLLHGFRQVLRVSPDGDEPVLIRDAAVEHHVVKRGAGHVAVDLPDQDLDLVWLHLLGEDRGERLRVSVGEVARLDVIAAV